MRNGLTVLESRPRHADAARHAFFQLVVNRSFRPGRPPRPVFADRWSFLLPNGIHRLGERLVEFRVVAGKIASRAKILRGGDARVVCIDFEIVEEANETPSLHQQPHEGVCVELSRSVFR